MARDGPSDEPERVTDSDAALVSAALEDGPEAYEGLERLQDPSRLGAWLRSIAIHRSINHLKRRQQVADPEARDEQAAEGPSPQAQVEVAELRQQVLQAIGRLSRAQRETVTLFYIGEYSLAEVAAIQGVPVGTVKRRLHDARGRLKEEMLGIVAEVLKDNAPDEALANRVYEALVAHPPGRRFDHAATQRVVAQFGLAGKEGFARSYALPHWRSRLRAVRFVARYYGNTFGEDGPPQDFALQLLVQALGDSHHRVRQTAATRLLYAHGLMGEEEWVRQVLPHLLALMTHECRDTRRRAVVLWAQEGD
ncbi:MAG: sigma-70 family RNA polymerase sigma factor [Candidatus Latescibacterota bacterium]